MNVFRWLFSPRYRWRRRAAAARTATTLPREAKVAIAAFDLDGTIERENTTSLCIREGVTHGFFPSSFGEDYERLRLLQRDHELSFEAYDRAMLEMFSHHMRGVPREDLEKIAQIVFQNHSGWRYLFTDALIRRVKSTHRTIIITGALEQIASRLAAHWGIDAHDASVLELDGEGKFTGETLCCPAFDKREALTRFAGTSDPSAFVGSVAIGDTMSDVPMLKMAEFPIAFNPVPRLARLAEEMDWPVVRERKGCITVTFRKHEELFEATTEAGMAVEYALLCKKPWWR
jgi:HAD superfamily phosphoserine phosphatase-like hydrolase